MIIGFTLMIGWSFFANAKIQPQWFGAICSMATIYIGIIVLMGLKSSLIEQMKEDLQTDGDEFRFMNKELAKNSWLDAKWNYYRENLIIDTKDAVPYSELWAR